MIPVIFINCRKYPFIQQIMSLDKQYETRTRNTMRKLMESHLGERFLLAETGHGDPVIRCSAVIDHIIAVYDRSEWEKLLPDTMTAGTDYDWKPDTKVKWLYQLKDVQPVKPFVLPKSSRRHGRIWTEHEGRV